MSWKDHCPIDEYSPALLSAWLQGYSAAHESERHEAEGK